MNYFKEYMMSVCAIIVITSVASEILVDFSWSKYINLICGVLFAVCLITPVSNLFNIDVSSLEFDYIKLDSDSDYISENVQKEFSDNLSKKIQSDIKNEFNKNINVRAGLCGEKLQIVLSDATDKNIIEYITREYRPYMIKILGEHTE